jgi:hypothetical protein
MDRFWPLDLRARAQQSEKRARASFIDGFGYQSERTDMKARHEAILRVAPL